jgi:hypothetical protein
MVSLRPRPLYPQGKICRCPLDMTLSVVGKQEMSLSEIELTSCSMKTNLYEKCQLLNVPKFGTHGHSSFAYLYHTLKIYVCIRTKCPPAYVCVLVNFNPLKTKRRPLYLKTQFVPRCKHFSSRLQKPTSLCCKWHKSLFVLIYI